MQETSIRETNLSWQLISGKFSKNQCRAGRTVQAKKWIVTWPWSCCLYTSASFFAAASCSARSYSAFESTVSCSGTQPVTGYASSKSSLVLNSPKFHPSKLQRMPNLITFLQLILALSTTRVENGSPLASISWSLQGGSSQVKIWG